MQVLVLEASTSSAKAAVYDKDKGIIRLEIIPFDHSVGDIAAQKTDAVYTSLLEAGKRAANGCDIHAIALGGIWHSLVGCDHNMNPVTPTYTWAYMGALHETAKLRQNTDFVNKVYQTTGCMVHAMYRAFQIHHLIQNGLEIKELKITGQGSYHFFKMTGEYSTSISMESGTALLNIHTLDYSEEMLDFAGIKRRQLPKLCSHKEVAPLKKEAAHKLGVAAGIPVVPALSDGALNQVGSGALRPGFMTFSVGTSAAMRLAADSAVIPSKPSTWCYYTAGKHLCGAATAGATNCVDWYMQNISDGRIKYSEIEPLAKGKEDAPVFLPFLFGERCPGWRDDKTGGFYGITGSTSMGDQYYAILEGVLFNLYQCYQKLTKLTGCPRKVFVSGGICNSELWLKMLTDIFQTEIVLLENEQASLLGGAVLALHACGAMENIENFTLETKRIIKPNPEKTDFYKKRYDRYLDFYNRF